MRVGVYLTALLIISLGTAGAVLRSADGAADSPRSLRARDAIARREATARKLRMDYFSRLADADAQLIRELDIALHVAASNADAEEIERITAARARAQQALKRDSEEAQGFTAFAIKADAGWQETIEVHRGDLVVVRASGKWTPNLQDPKSTCGPDGVGSGLPRNGALIGNLKGQKDDVAFQIGSGRQFVAPADGILELGMRGHAPIGSGLNDGTLDVLIKVTASTR